MKKYEEIIKIINKASEFIKNSQTTFRDIYEYSVSVNPKVVALVHHEKNGQIKQYTYEQYDNIVKRTARKLSILLFDKKKKNNIIALKIKNSPYWCFIFWALLMSGHRVLLIDANLPIENTNNLLKQAKAEAIISDDKKEYSVLTLHKDEINDISEDVNFKEDWANEVIFCSSGTTGDIKMMIFDGTNIIHQLEASKEMPKENLDIIYPQSLSPLRIIALIPFHHIFGFVAILMWYTFYSSTIVFTDFTEPIALIKDIKQLKITHIYHVPLFYEVAVKNLYNSLSGKLINMIDDLIEKNLKDSTINKLNFKNRLMVKKIKKSLFGTKIKYLISGGGNLNEHTSRVINGIGYPLYNGYGMTEIGVTSVELSTNPSERVKRSIGHPLYGITYKIGDKEELLVKTPTLHVKEIIQGEEVETKVSKDGFYATGDVVSRDQNNKFFIKGRLKEVIIKSNGENLYPDELESYFKNIKGLISCAIFSVKDKLIMVVHTDTDLTIELEKVNKSLPLSKQINEFVTTKEPLPLSSSLKVKRYLVKNNYLKQSFVAKVTKKKIDILEGYPEKKKQDVIKRLNKIYQNVLSKKGNIDENAHWINDLHSDSMTYITLIGEIEKEFNIKIEIEKYGELTTLNEFAKEILDITCK